jgi:hypothetical protein
MSTRRTLPGEPLRDCEIKIPLTADQLAKIRAAAALEGDSVASFVRSTLVCRARAVIGSVPGTRPTCELCGAFMTLHLWDRPGGAAGNGWSCSCVGPGAGDGSEAGA